MGKKIIAIAFSDLHLHKFKAFDHNGSRLSWSLQALLTIIKIAEGNRVPVLFAGDLFHNPKELGNQVLEDTITMWKGLGSKQPTFFAISGNHDMSERNSLTNKSPSYIPSIAKAIDSVFCIDNEYREIKSGLIVAGVPYMNSGKEWKQRIEETTHNLKDFEGNKILMLHGDMPGAKNPSGYEVGESGLPSKLDKFFKDWDLVLCGHIHRPQKLGKNCYMLGSPIHQDQGDIGCDMGFWEVYSDFSMEFVHLENFPKFLPVPSNEMEFTREQLGLEGRDYDYLVEIPEELTAEKEVLEQKFNIKNSRKKLAKNYMKATGQKDIEKLSLLTEYLNKA